MHIISNLNDTRFTLDGAQYLKNYISRISENRITIFNCYDNKDVLLPWIVYSEVQLNGSVYPNAQALHAAILDVIYLRTTLGNGPAFNQNNKGRVLYFGNYFVPNGLPIQNFQVATIVNALPFPIVIQADESPIFFSLIKEGKTYLFCFLGGKGTWGTNGGGTAVTSTQLTLVSIYSLTQNEVENNPGATIIALGDLPTGDYLTAANSAERDFSDSGTFDEDGNIITYYFSYTQDEVLYFVQFVGEAGVYGGGNANFLESDLVPSTNSDITPEQNLQQTIDNGSQYEGSSPVLINVTDGESYSALELTVEAASLKHNDRGVNISDDGAVLNIPVEYSEDFSAEYSDRSLVDKAYVDGVAGGTPTFQQVLEEGSEALGISTPIIIQTDNGTNAKGNISFNSSGVNIAGQGGGVNIIGGTNGISLGQLNTITGGNTADVTVNATNGGIKYSDDFSPAYTDRSLVDKEYVDNKAGIPLTGTEAGNPVTGDITSEATISAARLEVSSFEVNPVIVLKDDGGIGQIDFNDTENGLVGSFTSGGIVKVNPFTLNQFQVRYPNDVTANNTITFPENTGTVALQEYTSQILYNSATDSTTLTGTTTETVLGSFQLPANIGFGSFILDALFEKINDNALCNVRFYINTANSLSGATQLARNASGSASDYIPLKRDFSLGTDNNLWGLSFNASSGNDNTMDNNISTFAWTQATQYYIIATGQLTSSSDILKMKRFKIKFEKAS
ncbi:hypothetical protein [Flavobacterium coralii]|uniref:hypothetical protein n=1 Tax=Flavobacterium coralii TaxID=2838017 RepID=UPI000C4A4D9D|nr:hypothetical protein [Flavobacterium sp.]|tara:strand:- start:3945 stop:6143 length:2199 start_codon:yes stop_codon:yes gene_type:complete